MQWNRFDLNRNILEHQYDFIRQNPEVKAQVKQIEKHAEDMYRNRGTQPAILNRADIFAYVLEHAPIEIQPDDWFADHIETGFSIWGRVWARSGDYPPAYTPEQKQQVQDYSKNRIFNSGLDLSHTAPDWFRILELGPAGLRDAAAEAIKHASPGQKNFYQAVIQVYQAMIQLICRFADEADRLHADHISSCLRKIAVRPPETLQEALQLVLLYDTCQEIECVRVRSQGLFDRQFIRYYRHDLEQGILTRDQAKELIKYFWTKFYAQGFGAGKNIGFGGYDENRHDVCNELTELCFEIHRELGNIDPKLSLRVTPDTPDSVLKLTAQCIQEGKTAIVFSNDDTVTGSMMRHGKPFADASRNVLIGCYEPAVLGKEMCCSMSAWGNLVPPLEAVFNRGCTFGGIRIGPDQELPRNFEECKAAYLDQLDAMMDHVLENTRIAELTWKDVNPSPLISGTMKPCIDSGKDVSDAGTTYNSSGVMCAGFGTVIDSLTAVKYLVDDQKLCTMEQLADALRNNWKANEILRLHAQKRAPKWGNGNEEADKTAQEIFNHLAHTVNRQKNLRGGWFQLGLWSIDNNILFGKAAPATPDGRFAGEPLSRNMGGSAGMERNGASALIRSVTSLDLQECGDGGVLDVMLHPSAVSGADGTDMIAGLIRTYCAKGGAMVHFNVLNAEDLRKAQAEPGKYENLQIRVCGWNSRFVNLSADEQAFFIRQAEAAQ